MKAKFLYCFTVFFFVAGATASAAPTIPQGQETATEEIKGVVNAIIRGLEELDAEVLFQSYSNSPGFILFTTDGTTADYQMAKNHHVQWFKSLSSLKVTTVAEEFRMVSDDVAVFAWRATFAMTLKKGGEPTADFAITLVFNRIDNHWRVVYQQTSALPPAQKKPGK
jgi:uncharacterized protein (TIGR02246 family)